MKKFLIFFMGMVFVFGVAGLAAAQGGHTATQTVILQVNEINELATSGGVSLVVATATAGQDPEPATATSNYSITTNAANRKITGHLNEAVPDYTTLSVNMAAPSGVTSEGKQALGTTAVDLVKGISKKKGSTLDIEWAFEATAEAGVVESTTRTVTFTLTVDGE